MKGDCVGDTGEEEYDSEVTNLYIYVYIYIYIYICLPYIETCIHVLFLY